MKKTGDLDKGILLAMAGRKGPSGSGAGKPDAGPTSAATETETGVVTAGEGPTEAAKPAAPPRNPWLPPSDGAEPRRSASIEDILRQRGSRSGGSGRPAPRNWLPLVAAGVVATWLLGTSIHILGKGEQGLVTTTGRYDRTIAAGLSLTLPWPVQAVRTRDTSRIETLALPGNDAENLMLTRDRQLIDVDYQLRWRIADLRQFSYAFSDPDTMLHRLIDAQMHAAVAEMPFEGLWKGSRRNELQLRVAQRTQAVLDAWHSGIRVEGVEIARADPPGKLADAFRKIGAAREQARKDTEKAQKWAHDELSNAQTEAVAFTKQYDAYQAAPAVTRQRMYYETMERVLVNNKVVVSASGASVNLPATSTKPPQPASATGGQ